MKQSEYWNSVSDTKNFTTPFQLEAFSKTVSSDAAILDVGCGYGRTLEELYSNGYRDLTGIDFSEGMIRREQALYPYLDLRVKESAAIDFPDSTFDAVILFAVLTCIVKDSEQRELIDEIKRVLKPNGVLYINDFLLNTDERNLARYKKYEARYGTYGIFELPEGAVLRHHSEEYIKSLLSDFHAVAFESLTFTTMNGHTSNGFYYIGRK